MSSNSDDFVYVDDDGNPLPPEQATNVEIYVKFFKNAQQNSKPHGNKNDNNNDVEKKQSQQDSRSSALPSSFLAALGGVDKLRETAALLKEGKIEEEGPTKEETDETQDDDDDDDNNDNEGAEQKEDGENEDEEDEENEDEESEMYNSADPYEGFSRECTDQLGDEDEEEQWVLEEILRRKLKKKITPSDEADAEDGTTGLSPNHRADTLDDYDDDELIAQHKSGVKKSVHNKVNNNNNLINKTATSVPQYLCKWRWYSKPTWETRDALLELGYGNKVQDYDVAHASYVRPTIFTHEKLKKLQRSSKNLLPLSDVFGRPVINKNTYLIGRENFRYTVFERVFPDYLEFIHDQLGRFGFMMTDIANIAPPAASAAFLERWSQNPMASVTRTFHGTGGKNINGICRMGLCVPNSRPGVTVQNGSACGICIYTSSTPMTPITYSRDCPIMFVCAAMDSDESCRWHHDWRLFDRSDAIVPVWLVRFAHKIEPPRNYCPHFQEARRLTANFDSSKTRFIKMHRNHEKMMAEDGLWGQFRQNGFEAEGARDDQKVQVTLTGDGIDVAVAQTDTPKPVMTQEEIDQRDSQGQKEKNTTNTTESEFAPVPTTAKFRSKEIGNKKISKRLIKQLPRSLKEVYGM